MFNRNQILLFWAKSAPYHPLLYHSIDAGAMTRSILSHPSFSYLRKTFDSCFTPTNQLNTSDLIDLVSYFASLHDFGKLSDKFQGKRDAMIEFLADYNIEILRSTEPFRHEVLSSSILSNDMGLRNVLPSDLFPSFLWMIRSHHSKDITEENEYSAESMRWAEVRSVFKEYLEAQFLHGIDRNQFRGIRVSNFAALSTILLGTLILADWLVSNPQVYDYETLAANCEELYNNDPEFYGQNLTELLNVYKNNAINHAEQVLNSMGFGGSIIFPTPLDYVSLFHNEIFRTLRPIQEQISTLSSTIQRPGLTLIEAPMGEGKTEAAIYEAVSYIQKLGLNGFYFALPTAATSNQMFSRIKKCLEALESNFPPNLRLVHSTALLLDDVGTNISAEMDAGDRKQQQILESWFHPNRRGILAPYCVGTVDQVMKAVMKGKFSILRLFGLMNKVLIIDEIHSYDTYMMESIEMLVKWCAMLKIPIILLSATLPEARKNHLFQQFSEYSNPNFSNHEFTAPQLQFSQRRAYPLITHYDP